MSYSVYATTIKLDASMVGGQIYATNLYAEAHAALANVPVQATMISLRCFCEVPTPGPYVPTDATMWTLKPDWQNGVTERLKWKTDILTSQTGVEQRRQLRLTPRRDIEARYLLYRDRRRFYENLLNGPGASYFQVPCWWEKLITTAAVGPGETTIPCDTTGTEIQAGDTVVILGDEFTFDLAVVGGVGTNMLTLRTTLALNWAAGASVYLTKRCMLTGEQNASQRSDDVREVTLTFETREPNKFPAVAPVQTLNGLPILYTSLDYREDTTTEYQRLLTHMDNEVASPIQLDNALQAFRLQQVEFTAFNKTVSKSLRSMFYWINGKVTFFYFPTHAPDIVLALDIGATDTVIQIQDQGYSLLGGSNSIGRTIIAVFFNNGLAPVLATITGSVLQENGYEALTLAAAFGFAIPMITVAKICFVQLYRSDVDELTVDHVTDSVLHVKTMFRSCENNRTAVDYVTTYQDGLVENTADS